MQAQRREANVSGSGNGYTAQTTQWWGGADVGFVSFSVCRISGEADRQSVVFRLISFPSVGTPINSRSPIRISSSLTNQPFFLF
jgi:hypothetical protein